MAKNLELLQPFMTFTGAVNYFLVENEGHRYEAFIDSNFSTKNNVNDLQQNERLFETQINIKVLAHLVGDGINSAKPKISRRENIVEVKIPREYIVLGETRPASPFPLEDAILTEDGLFILTNDGKYILIE